MAPDKCTCGSCGDNITKKHHSLLCNGICKQWFHKICTGLTEDQYKNVTNKISKGKWVCEPCKQKVEVSYSGSDYDSAEDGATRSNSKNKQKKTGKTTKMKVQTQVDVDAILSKDNPTVRELLLVINKKFDTMETSMNFHSEMVDEMHKTLQEMRNENSKLRKENEDMKTTIKQLQNDVLNLQLMNKNHEEVSQRNKNVVIFGMKEGKDVCKILDKLNVPCQSEDYTIKTIPSKAINKPILVSFKSEELRNMVIEKRKLKKVIDTTECNIEGPKRKIYINEDVPRETRVLFNKTKKLKTEKNFKFVWIKNGQVYCCESEETRAIRIVNPLQVEELLKVGV